MRNLLILAVFAMALLFAGCSLMEASKIESAVLEALAADEELSQFSFDVTWQDNGEVYITGEVFNPAQHDRVSEVAGAVAGVAGVINKCSLPEEGNSVVQDVPTGSVLF